MKFSIISSLMLLIANLSAETPPPASPPAATDPCSQLSDEEQAFASQLTNPDNHSLFCSQFTSVQRKMAMQLSGQVDANGNKITPDQAVQQLVLSGKTGPSTTPMRRPGGSCPLQSQ